MVRKQKADGQDIVKLLCDMSKSTFRLKDCSEMQTLNETADGNVGPHTYNMSKKRRQ